jgi:hypothetical protein
VKDLQDSSAKPQNDIENDYKFALKRRKEVLPREINGRILNKFLGTCSSLLAPRIYFRAARIGKV